MTRSRTAAGLLVCAICLVGCGRYGPPERRPAPSMPPVSAAGSGTSSGLPAEAEQCGDPDSKAEAPAETPE